jgi:hypothetical protein
MTLQFSHRTFTDALTFMVLLHHFLFTRLDGKRLAVRFAAGSLRRSDPRSQRVAWRLLQANGSTYIDK